MDTEVSSALSTLELDPQNKDARAALSRHAEAADGDRAKLAAALATARAFHAERGNVDLSLELLDRELAITLDKAARADLLAEKARLLFHELARAEVALECLREALEAVQGHSAAGALLRKLQDEEAEWEKTAQTRLKQAKDAGSKPSAAPHYAVAGELYLKYRPRSQEGESFLRRAVEIDARQKRADLLLERIYRTGGRTDDLAELYDRRIASAANNDDRAAAEVAAGEVAIDRGKQAEAIEHFKKALAASPGEPRALHRVVAALTLQGEQGQVDAWAELARVYEAALRVTKRGQGEMFILLPLAQVTWRRLGDLEQAELYFRRIKKAEPSHPIVMEFYRDFHTRRNEIPQLLALLAQAQKSESDPDKRILLGIEMAELAEQRPQSAEKAIDIWKGLLKLRPGLPEAVTALRRLYTKTEKWNALLEMLKDDLEALPRDAADEKIARYLEMIPIYRDRLRLEVMVTNTFAAILALRPDHPDALRALAERHEAQGRWADLIEVLQRQAAATESVADKVALYHRTASLWADKLAKQQNAIGALEKILELDPREETARRRLRDIYTRTRAFRPLLDLMRRELTVLPADRHRTQLAEMAELAAERLGQPREAIALWNEILANDTNGSDAEALAALAGLYEKEKRWAALAEILGRQAALAGAGSAEACERLERRGLILLEKLGAPAAAEETLKAVHAAQPENPRVLRALREIYATTGDLSAFEALYVARGAWDDLYEALLALVDRTPDAGAQVKLLERAAEIAEKQLAQPERAIKVHEKIFALRPRSRSVAKTLLRLYREAERWPRLLATYEAILGENSGQSAEAAVDADEAPLSAEEQLSLLTHARRVSEEKLGSKTLAFQWCARAYGVAQTAKAAGTAIDPAVVLGELERLAGEADEWEAYAELLSARLPGRLEKEERTSLLRRLLRATGGKQGRLNRPDEARRYAEELLALEPDDQEAEAAFERALEERKEWPGLVKIWRRREERLHEGPERIELLFRIARAEEEELGDLTAAARTLRSILDAIPGQPQALSALARVAEVTGDLATVASILRRQIAEGQLADPLPALLRLGRIEETELLDADKAKSAYLEVLELDPVSPEAVAGLERLLEAKAIDDAEIPPVLTRLIPHYELTENYTKWAQALETLAARAPAAERKDHLELLVDLYSGPLGNGQGAFQAAMKIFELDPHTQSNRDRLLGMAIESGAESVETLLTAVRRVLAGVEEPGFRRELLAFIAEIDEKRPGGGEEAERVYREILSLDPLHFGAYRALTRLYRDAERWSDLRHLLEVRQEGLPETKERLALLWQIAEIDEALLEDRDHVIGVLNQILGLEPGDMRAFRSLEKHYTNAQRWAELEGLLERETGLARGDEAVELASRRAHVLHERLQQSSRALDLLEEVVARRPEHGGARRLLEEILALPEHRQRTAAILEPLYERSGDASRLVAVLEAQCEVREGPDAAELLARIAGIQEERLEDAAAAAATWRRILDLDPGSERALAEVERLTRALEREADLIPLYDTLATRTAAISVSGAADLLTRAARLQVSLLGDREAAIRTWRRILDLDPANLETARPAVDALETLYAQVGDFRGFVDILRAKSEWAADDRERGEILRRVAELEEKALGDLPAAVATYRALLDAEPDDQVSLVELERLYESLGQHRDRVDIMRRRLESTSEAADRRTIRFRMAVILERELADVDEAISTVLAILDEATEDLPALEMLASLYERKGATTERLEVLDRQLVLATSPDARIEILRRMASLLEGPLARPGEALERWREVLDLAPYDGTARERVEAMVEAGARHDKGLRLAAAQVLEPLYQAAGEWAKLAGLLELYVVSAEDPRDRMGHRVRLAELQEHRLGAPAAALSSYAEAIRDGLGEPQLADLLDAYERVADELGQDRSHDVVALYRAVEGDVLVEGVRLRMAGTIAHRAEALGDDALASEYFRKVLERRPDDGAVLVALERLYRRTDDLPALLEILERRADLVSGDAASEVPLRLQVGALALRLQRPVEAVAAYERVYTMRPGDPEAFAALDRLYAEGKSWTDLCGLLERQLGRGLISSEAVALHQRLAEVYLNELADRDQALIHLGAALKLDQDHEPAITRLQALLEDTDAQIAAADLLEAVYVRRSDWQRLVAIDELRLERSDDPGRRLALTQRIARVFEEQIEDLEAAFKWYGRVFRETPTERAAQEQLLRLAPKLSRWKEVSDWFGAFLDDESANTDEVLEIVRLAAQVADERLDDRETARKHYRRYVEAQPGDPRACRLFEAALERWESWEELRDLLEEHATRLDNPGQRVPYLRRSAALSAEKLQDRERAASSLRNLLDIDPKDARATADLETLLRADERWSDLREHLLWTLEQVQEGPDQNAIAFRLAEVEEQQLGEVGAAVERYGEILVRTPRHTGALAALERLIEHPDYRLRVAEILEPHFRRTQEWRKLADVLEVSLEGMDDSARQSAVLAEVAVLEEKLGRLDRSLEARGRAWLADVASADTLELLEAAAAKARAYARLVEILREGTTKADNPDIEASLWAMVAGLYETRLGDVSQAVEAWRSAITARPDDEGAFAALERLLAQAGRSAELCETLEQHLEIVRDAAERETLSKRVAVLYEDVLKDPEKAVEAWRAVLEVDDADEEAMDALARLYTAAEAWRDLVDVYQRKLELAKDPAAARYLRFLAARTYDEKLSEPEEAASQLRAVLDAHPGDGEALSFLDRIFTREQQHPELLEILDQRAAAAAGPEAEALAFRAAQLVEKELDDATGAIARYQDLLGRAPAHEGTREALWALARGDSYRQLAVAALEPVLRAGKEWPALVELLELRLEVEEAPGVRLEILSEIARIREEEQRDFPRAFAAWATAFAENASDSGAEFRVRESLERLAAATGDFARLAQEYEARLDESLDAQVEQVLAWRLSEIHEEKLGDPAKAVEFLRRVAALPGQEERALARLEVLLGRLARYRELEEVLAREAEVSSAAEAQAGYLAALGDLRLQRLDDAEGAVQAFRDALDRDPTHLAALGALRGLLGDEQQRRDVVDILEPLAESRGDFAELAQLYEVRIGLEDSAPERAAWWKRVAEIAEDRLGDRGRALEALGRSLRDDPSAPEVAEALERVGVEMGAPAAAAERLEAVLDELSGSSLVELCLRAAHLYEQGARTAPEHDAAAERLYRRALAEENENQRALEALEALYRRQDEPLLLAQILEQRGAVEMDPDRRRAFLSEAGRIHERQGDAAAAIAAWQAAREGEEGNAEVLGELARLLQQQGDTAELAKVLEERARFSDDNKERAALFLQLGELRRGPLADQDGAAAAFREVLDLFPNDRGALAALATLEADRGDFSALEEVLLRRLSVAEGTEKAEVLFSLARNAEEKLEDADRAASYLHQVLEMDPESRPAYEALARLLEGSERWYDVIELHERRATVEARLHPGDAGPEIACRLAVANIWGEKLGDEDSAREAIQKVLARAPSHGPALLALAGLHERAGALPEAAEALARAAAVSATPAERAEVHFRRSRVLEAQGAAPEEVEACLRAAVESDPTHLPALKALEARARQAGQPADLVRLLESRLGLTPAVQERKALLTEIAALYRGPLGAPGNAIGALGELAALNPADLQVQEDLATALIAAGRAPEAEQILTAMLETASKARQNKAVARAQRALGALAESQGNLAVALQRFEAAYQLDPSQPAVVASLAKLAMRQNEAEKARRFCRALLLQTFDPATAGITKGEVYLALGRLHVQANEIPKARNMFERGLETDPKNTELKEALAALPRG